MLRHSQNAVYQAVSRGRLTAHPSRLPTDGQPAPLGLQALGAEQTRDALLYIPSSYRPDHPAPLALMLHGAGGRAQNEIDLLLGLADATGLLLLAPASRDYTWDILIAEYGPDIRLIDRALAQTFSRYAVDSMHIAIGGFSDGASYALSVGLTNGDLFTHVIAFSPGFMAPAARRGTPRIYISHGTHDTVLPIERCSRRIVPQLERADYAVRYHEFDGPHTVPAEIAKEAVDWFVIEKG